MKLEDFETIGEILNNMEWGFVLFDKDFNILYINDAFIRISKIDPRDVEKCRKLIKEAYEKCFKDKITKTTLIKEIENEYGTKYIKIKIFPINNGEEEKIIALCEDVTQEIIAKKKIAKYYRKLIRSYEGIKKLAEWFKTVFELSPDYVIIYKKDGRLLNINKRARELFQIKEKDIKKLTIYDFLPEKYKKIAKERMEKILKGELPSPSEFLYEIDWKGRKRYVLVNTSCLKYNDDSILISTLKDITELKEKENELKVLCENLKSLDFLKSCIINNVSHELKTPITVIKGVLDELHEELEDNEKYMELLKIANRNIKRLLEIIDDLLIIARLARGDYKAVFDVFHIDTIIDEVIKEKRDFIKSKKVEVIKEVEPIPIVADKVLIKHALLNLLDNAIKFNKDGGKIFIRAFKKGENLILEVEDTGIGISEDKIDKIFEPFYQVDPSMHRKHGGTGIGLAVVKRVVGIHNGRISVESKVGVGTKFRIELPLSNRE